MTTEAGPATPDEGQRRRPRRAALAGEVGRWRARTERVGDAAGGATELVRGLVPLRRATPRRLARLGWTWSRQGLTLGSLATFAAIREGTDTALVDDDGAVTATQLHRWAATVAGELNGRGVVPPGHRVGVLCRNGRGLVVALLAAARLGADVVLLATDADGPALAGDLRREHLHVVVHDDEFTNALAGARFLGTTILADRSAPGQLSLRDLELLPQAESPHPTRQGLVFVPAAARGQAAVAIDAARALRVPIARGVPIVLAAPLWSPIGLATLASAFVRQCPLVVTAHADAPAIARLVDDHRASTLVVDARPVPGLLDELAANPPGSPPPLLVVGGPVDGERRARAGAAFGRPPLVV